MTTASPTTDTPTLLRLICRALDEKKAEEVRVLRVGEISSITDFLILATGTSDPHLRALRVELEKVIDATGTRILGMDTGLESGWLVIDAFDVMIHVLTPENRKRYAIEALWGDAEDIPLADVMSEKGIEATKPAKKARKTAASKGKKAAVSKTGKKPAKKGPTAKAEKSKKSAKGSLAASVLRKASSKRR
ncbi:MAG: ribosome silencing factor [Opitutaceae bacterium]|nr:ribosome silencing factor [Opitutaceae bacterium]